MSDSSYPWWAYCLSAVFWICVIYLIIRCVRQRRQVVYVVAVDDSPTAVYNGYGAVAVAPVYGAPPQPYGAPPAEPAQVPGCYAKQGTYGYEKV